MRQISVIICSLNPRSDYFGRVLESLRAQTLDTDQWELLLVDNASDRPLADSWDLSWHPHHLKVREEEQGLTPARLRGIKESEGQLIVFVDDDVLASNYLERALEVERAYPFVGVFGAGVLTPEFEVEPRPHVGPSVHYWACERCRGCVGRTIRRIALAYRGAPGFAQSVPRRWPTFSSSSEWESGTCWIVAGRICSQEATICSPGYLRMPAGVSVSSRHCGSRTWCALNA